VPPGSGFAVPSFNENRSPSWYHYERYCLDEYSGVLSIDMRQYAKDCHGNVRRCEDLPDIASYQEAS
jgi:hypothetical protein